MSKKDFFKFSLFFALAIALDQGFKFLCLFLQARELSLNLGSIVANLEAGFYFELWRGAWMDLRLVLNKGVAFSMFSFLEHYLKYLHLALLALLFIYLFWQKSFLKAHLIAFALMLGAGFSNLADRFVWNGVVDMFFWHKGFEFAIFNVADVIINLSVAMILIKELFFKEKA